VDLVLALALACDLDLAVDLDFDLALDLDCSRFQEADWSSAGVVARGRTPSELGHGGP
jgi:hypothetical protein